MFVVKCHHSSGAVLWNVGGHVRVLTVESAVDLAFDALAEQMRVAVNEGERE